MKTLAALITVVFLVGCASTPPRIEVPKEVKVLVPVVCRTEEPAAPTLRFAPPYTSVFEAARDLLGDNELRDAYENELRIALKSCK